MAEERKTILRREVSDSPFTIIPKTLMDDPRLSWKAKGILAYLLGKKCNWIVRISDLCNHSNDGESAIRAGILELRTLHYAHLAPCREDGKISDWILTVSDKDDLPPETHRKDKSPDSENQHLEKPHIENHHLSKNDTTKNDPNILPATPSQADSPKKKVKKTTPPNPEHKRFIELWTERYQARFGHPYVFQGGKDAKAVHRLLVATKKTAAELIPTFELAWNIVDFNCKQAVSISGGIARFNEIRQEIQKAGDGNPRQTPTPAWKLKQEMEEKIHELEGETHYDHQKRKSPEKVALLLRLRKELETLKLVPCPTN